ncbi:MAG TPA: hypothetical protein VGF95_08910 [Solirubrobacteraceae bacterium]
MAGLRGSIRERLADLRERPLLLSGCALGVTLIASTAMAIVAGPGAVLKLVDRIQPIWLVLILAGRIVSYAGYTLAYRRLMGLNRGPSMRVIQAASLVSLGFAVFSLGGGFTIDHDAIRKMGHPKHEAAIRILGLGALEYAVLAPLAWVSAMLLLGAPHVKPSMTLPWAIGVPAGFVCSVIVIRACHHAKSGGWHLPKLLDHTVQGLNLVYQMVIEARSHRLAWLGMLVYWAGELAALWAGLTLIGVPISLVRLTLAYATGYIFTPRSLPLAGVGVSEVLLTIAVHWVGVPLPSAVVAVFFYRAGILLVSIPPAVLARLYISHLQHKQARASAT